MYLHWFSPFVLCHFAECCDEIFFAHVYTQILMRLTKHLSHLYLISCLLYDFLAAKNASSWHLCVACLDASFYFRPK